MLPVQPIPLILLTKMQIALSSVGGTRVVHIGRADPSAEAPPSLSHYLSLSTTTLLTIPSQLLPDQTPSSFIPHHHHFPMASASAVAMVLPTIGNCRPLAGSDAFSNPMRMRSSARAAATLARSGGRLEARASAMNDKAVAGLTAAAVTAALLIPDIAEAAQPGVSPSLENFLLSIVSGGVVLSAIVGAVVGVANFDPVKRS